MTSYSGTDAQGAKARTLANEREKAQELFKKQQDDIKKANQVKLADMSQANTEQRESSCVELSPAVALTPTVVSV